MKQKPYVVVTGDGEGLGNAAVDALLRLGQVQVLGVSRRAREQVVGVSRWDAVAPGRYTHLQADLADAESVARLADDILQRVGDASIASVLLVNGTGYLDTEVEERPELQERMEILNLVTPRSLLRALMPKLRPGAPLFYYSGLVVHPSITDPVLSRHAEIKTRATAVLREEFGAPLKALMPGAYRTEMLQRNICRQNALLEWFAIPTADPYERGGLSEVVAKHVLLDHSAFPASMIRPRLCHLLVKSSSAEQVLASLPGAIRRAARAILADNGQSDADHDARVRYFEERQLYGASFPYSSIRSQHLWPLALSRVYCRSLKLAGMLR